MINPMSSPDLTAAEIEAVTQVLQTPYLSLGPRVAEFREGAASARTTTRYEGHILSKQEQAGMRRSLDSFPDLVVSKMVALVERGAPRDFRDIHALCQAGLTTPHECWDLWHRRQQLAGSDTESARAWLAIETHLSRIAQHRPLAQIADPQQRVEAEGVRGWFTGEFLNALQFH